MASIKELSTNFHKLDKFEGVGFRRWQKKMHFLLSALGLAYVLNTPVPEAKDDETPDDQRKRTKWENDNHVCIGTILNGMSDPLFDVYQNELFAKSLWDKLEAKYMLEDASSKKFLVSNFNSYKMVDGKSVMEQFHEIQRIVGNFHIHKITIDDNFIVSSIIDKLPPSWKNVKHDLKHKKEDITLEQLASHLQVEEGIRAQENSASNPNMSTVNVVEDGKSSKANQGKRKDGKPNKSNKKNKNAKTGCWECGKEGHIKKNCYTYLKRIGKSKASGQGETSQGLSEKKGNFTHIANKSTSDVVAMISQVCYVQDDVSWWIDSGASRHVCKDKCYFKSFRKVEDGQVLYMGNDSVANIVGIGDVNLYFTSGNIVELKDVYYSPSLRRNLVSGSILNRLGFKLVFESSKC